MVDVEIRNKITELALVWQGEKNPMEVAKLAYIIRLDFCNQLSSDILEILYLLMIMEVDECMILDDGEIERLIQSLKSFAYTE